MIHLLTVMKCVHTIEVKELKKEDRFPQENISNYMNKQDAQNVNL
jgi:hypothetical protein